MYNKSQSILTKAWPGRWLFLSVLALTAGFVQLFFFVLAYSNSGVWDIDWVFGIVVAYIISLALSLKVIRDKNREIRRSEEQLIQSEKLSALGQLVSGVAHEINNPLAGIMGYAGLILEEGGLREEVRRDVENIRVQARRARDIIENLLTFARPGQPRRVEVDLKGIIRSVMDLQTHEMRTKGIEARVEVGDDIGPVIGDPGQLQQVVMNLILNACQSMSACALPDSDHGRSGRHADRDEMKSGCIYISVTSINEGSAVRLEIKDDGPGIPEEELNKIFEPFFTKKDPGNGTGLGLSVTYGIVRAHNGNIYAENVPGGGARFVVELPAIKE